MTLPHARAKTADTSRKKSALPSANYDTTLADTRRRGARARTRCGTGMRGRSGRGIAARHSTNTQRTEKQTGAGQQAAAASQTPAHALQPLATYLANNILMAREVSGAALAAPDLRAGHVRLEEHAHLAGDLARSTAHRYCHRARHARHRLLSTSALRAQRSGARTLVAARTRARKCSGRTRTWSAYSRGWRV